jgi:PAN domain
MIATTPMLRTAAMRGFLRAAAALAIATLALAAAGHIALAKERKSMLQGVTECKAWCDKRHATPSSGIQTCYRKCEAYWMCYGSDSTEESCKDGRALLERTSTQLPEGMENNTDRPGADFGSFSVTSASVCRNFCIKDDRCKAWTYVRPRIHGPNAVCYLKNAMPPATTNKCCISGVVPRGPVGVSPSLPPPASQN